MQKQIDRCLQKNLSISHEPEARLSTKELAAKFTSQELSPGEKEGQKLLF